MSDWVSWCDTDFILQRSEGNIRAIITDFGKGYAEADVYWNNAKVHSKMHRRQAIFVAKDPDGQVHTKGYYRIGLGANPLVAARLWAEDLLRRYGQEGNE